MSSPPPLHSIHPQSLRAEFWAAFTGLPICESGRYQLHETESHLALHAPAELKLLPFWIDFTGGALQQRRQQSGRRQPLARAVGVKPDHFPSVLDLTAGLGEDAFILASLGCKVHMLERAPIPAALLTDALNRLYADAKASAGIELTLSFADAEHYFTTQPNQSWETLYLDPMFPPRQKSARVKKNMQLLQGLLSSSVDDGSSLFACARQQSAQRWVIKRPKSAPTLNPEKPHHQIQSGVVRFDVYTGDRWK